MRKFLLALGVLCLPLAVEAAPITGQAVKPAASSRGTDATDWLFFSATLDGQGNPAVIFKTYDTVTVAGTVTVVLPASGVGVTLWNAESDVVLTVTQNPGATWYVEQRGVNLTITATGAADAGITLSLAAVAGNFHYITLIEIIKYVTATIAASATPIILTTTNWDTTEFYMRRVGALADTEVILYQPALPIKSDAVNTATTIVMPAVTGVKWIAKVHYYTAP